MLLVAVCTVPGFGALSVRFITLGALGRPKLETSIYGSDLVAAQGRRMRSACDQGGHEIVVPSGGFVLALEARLQCGVGASKVERDFAEQGQVPGCVALAYSARVFVEPDVEYPMQPVLDRPMASDGGGELCRR